MANQSKKSVNDHSEEIKSETKNTVNDVKSTIKDVNIKKDAKETSGFVSALFKNPLETLKSIANDSKNLKFKNALIVLIIWIAVIFIKLLFGSKWSFHSLGSNLLNIITSLLEPICGIVTLVLIVYFFANGKSKKKSFTTIITTLTAAVVPKVLVVVISLLNLLSRQFSIITNPLSSLASVISIVFIYFAMKFLSGEEENSKFIRTFIKAQTIYFIVYFALSFLGINIPTL